MCLRSLGGQQAAHAQSRLRKGGVPKKFGGSVSCFRHSKG